LQPISNKITFKDMDCGLRNWKETTTGTSHQSSLTTAEMTQMSLASMRTSLHPTITPAKKF
jgi:hypothetical protein